MTADIAQMIVFAFGTYFGVGLVFALLFVMFGAGKIDPAAKSMPIRVRLFILPGVMALWPLMLAKWMTQTEPPIS